MAATFGITQLPDEFETPVGCVVKQVQDKESLETVKYRNESGIGIRNIPKKLITREVTIDVIGIAPLTLVAAGEFEEGVLKVMRVRVNENNDDVPSSTITMKSYATAAAPGGGEEGGGV